jgi:dTDP-4-amino-4,6-dideoxygalactose transaminase
MITTFSVKIYPEAREMAAEVLGTTWVGMGPKVKELENSIGGRLGLRYPVALSSCTASLEIALTLCRVGSNNGGSCYDEVITTPMSFLATNSSILRAGAKPVFVDVDSYCNIDASLIEAAITEDTKAIMCVHMYGLPCDMTSINDIATRHGLYVIEDCAHAFDAEYRGRKIGSEDNNIHCYSFQSVKNLTTIEGGLISVPNRSMYEEVMRRRWYGIERDDPQRSFDGTYDLSFLGGKFNMVDVNAAIGLGQLIHMDEDNDRRRVMADLYSNNLSDKVSRLCTEYGGRKHARHAYTVKFRTMGDRDSVIAKLKESEIQTMILYRPHSYYRQFPRFNGTMTDKMYQTILTLPFHMNLTDEDILRTCSIVNEVVM